MLLLCVTMYNVHMRVSVHVCVCVCKFPHFCSTLYTSDGIYALIWSPTDMTDMFLAVLNTKHVLSSMLCQRRQNPPHLSQCFGRNYVLYDKTIFSISARKLDVSRSSLNSRTETLP